MKKSFLKIKESNEKILEDLIPLIESFKNEKLKEQTLIEPFLGSGSIFLNIEKFKNFILNDLSVDIFMLFNQIKNNSSLLIEDSKKIFTIESNQKDFFDKMSNLYNKSNNYYEICKIYMYLNRHGIKIPINNEIEEYVWKFKNYKTPYFPEKEINLMSNKFKKENVQIFNHSFERIFDNLEYGDVVYCDPPEISNLNEFTYAQHQKLNHLAISASLKGVSIIISNSYNEISKELYKDCSEYYIKTLNKSRKEEIIAIYA